YRTRLSTHYAALAEVERQRGRLDEAAAAARKRLDLWPGHADELYLVACDLALTAAAGEQGRRDRHSALALAVLRQAIAAGFRDAKKARTDPALKALRSRPDFPALLADLERRSSKSE